MPCVESGPGVRGFLAMPHGVLSIVPMIFGGAALALGLVSVLTCQFLEVMVKLTDYRGIFDDQGNVTSLDRDVSRGIEHYGLTYECRESIGFYEFNLPNAPLSNEEEDENPFNPFTDPDFNEQTENRFRTALAWSLLSIMVGGMTLIFILLGTCIAYRKLVLVAMGGGFFLASVSSFFSLLAFSAKICDDFCISPLRNDTLEEERDVPLAQSCHEGCRGSVGSGLAIAASMLWLVAAVVTCLVEGGDDDDDDDDDNGGAKPEEAKSLMTGNQEQEEVAPEAPTDEPQPEVGQEDQGEEQVLQPQRQEFSI